MKHYEIPEILLPNNEDFSCPCHPDTTDGHEMYFKPVVAAVDSLLDMAKTLSSKEVEEKVEKSGASNYLGCLGTVGLIWVVAGCGIYFSNMNKHKEIKKESHVAQLELNTMKLLPNEDGFIALKKSEFLFGKGLEEAMKERGFIYVGGVREIKSHYFYDEDDDFIEMYLYQTLTKYLRNQDYKMNQRFTQTEQGKINTFIASLK